MPLSKSRSPSKTPSGHDSSSSVRSRSVKPTLSELRVKPRVPTLSARPSLRPATVLLRSVVSMPAVKSPRLCPTTPTSHICLVARARKAARALACCWVYEAKRKKEFDGEGNMDLKEGGVWRRPVVISRIHSEKLYHLIANPRVQGYR